MKCVPSVQSALFLYYFPIWSTLHYTLPVDHRRIFCILCDNQPEAIVYELEPFSGSDRTHANVGSIKRTETVCAAEKFDV